MEVLLGSLALLCCVTCLCRRRWRRGRARGLGGGGLKRSPTQNSGERLCLASLNAVGDGDDSPSALLPSPRCVGGGAVTNEDQLIEMACERDEQRRLDACAAIASAAAAHQPG